MTYPGPANSGTTPDRSFRLADMTGSQRRRLWPWLLAVAAIVVASAAGLILSRPDPSTSVSLVFPAAARECHERVKAGLKAPGTARFGEAEYSTTAPNVSVRVSGWVDAENGFGALVRNRYSCTATPTDSGWSVSEAAFDDW